MKNSNRKSRKNAKVENVEVIELADVADIVEASEVEASEVEASEVATVEVVAVDSDIEAQSKALHASIHAQLDNIIRCESANNESVLVRKFTTEKLRFTDAFCTSLVTELNLSASDFDAKLYRSDAKKDRIAIYAMQKVTSTLRAVLANTLSVDVIDRYTRDLFKFFANNASAKSLSNKAFNNLIIAQYIAASTATTQTSSTRKALQALNMIDYREHETLLNADSVLTQRLLAVASK